MSDAGRTLAADVSGLLVRFGGLDDALRTALTTQWAPFVSSDAGTPWMQIDVGVAGHAIATGRAMRPSVTGEVRYGGGRFTSDEGDLTIGADGRARIRLGTGDDRWRYWGLLNLMSAALAVRLPSRPGALLHAAGIVVDGRAFLLVGAEGAGKSTFARCARHAGARVISDDAVLLDGGLGALSLLGSPVRAHEASSPGPGRWPVAAILHPRRGTTPRLDGVGRVAAEAAVTANLPFLVSGWGCDPRLDVLASFLAEAVPHRTLTFASEPSFVGVLRDAAF